MAVHVAFFSASHVGGSSVPEGKPTDSEALTSGSTTATAQQGQLAHVTCYTADAYVVAGQSETASATNGYRLPVGASMDIGPLNAGDKISMANA